MPHVYMQMLWYVRVCIIHCLCVPLHMTMMVVVVRVGFVQDTPYQFQENESPTILVGIFTEIVAGRRAIITATEEGNGLLASGVSLPSHECGPFIYTCFLPADIGDTEFVQESFLLGAVDLIFDDNPNPIQLFPLIEDDNVGLEDPETSTLVLRPGGTTDPAKVIINPARVDIIVLDNEGTSLVCSLNGMNHVYIYISCLECSESL